MVRLEEGLKQLTDVTNFHIYASYQINVAQAAVFRLQLGLGAAEANVDKIFEYLRVMTTQRASPAVIPPIALRELLRKVRAKMKPNPRLRLPYDPDTKDIWKYYKVIKITPVVIDKLLVILLTIPIIDSTLELNIYRAHNLPAIPPGHKIATKYLLEGDYFAIGKHGVYAALPSERSIQVCLESDLAICMMQQALYPMMHITWCIFALFVEDEARVQWNCKYEVKPFLDNRAQSLGGYMWAISSIEQEQLQIRCLEETQVIQIRPPLQVVYIGNGCEGYSPSMYITIPIIDSTLELNIYRTHNLPAIPPGHKIATKYLLEGDYFAIGKHGVYAALPSERSIQVCLESDLAICMMQQALYPTMHITWCIYALFMEDEAQVQRDCKYKVKSFLDNRAQSLGGYMWAISSMEQEQLQIRCLEETQVIQIRPPLQVVYIGNGCEGYSPSMYIPAKSELSGTEEIESRKEYFLKFNYVYQPDELIGVWWQFRSKLMTIEEAENFVEKVEPLGTMDYSILN